MGEQGLVAPVIEDSGTAAEEIIGQQSSIFPIRFQNANLDAIATEAGCAKGTLYQYFENKKDLFLKVVDYVMQGLLCTTTSTQDDDPLIKVEQGIRAYLAT